MLDKGTFEKIIKEENISIHEEKMDMLFEFTDIVTEKLLDDWIKNKYC